MRLSRNFQVAAAALLAALCFAVAQQNEPSSNSASARPVPPLLAQDVYKNVEIFHDRPATDLLPAMDRLRHQLGIDCAWCHIQYQWEKDDLKPKQTARMMFHMTDFINSDLFAGKDRVNCWTCHRAQPIPATPPVTAEKPPGEVAAEMFIRITPEQADQPAKKVFHNLQIVKDVPAKQLPMIMAYFSRSLGVRCMFCHNLDDFPSDEKPPKRMARKMLRMVQDVRQHFYNGGDIPVGCYTCHQGEMLPPEGNGLAESSKKTQKE